MHIFIFRGNDDNDAHVHGFETFISLKRYIVFIIFYLKYVDGAFNALSGNLKQNTRYLLTNRRRCFARVTDIVRDNVARGQLLIASI